MAAASPGVPDSISPTLSVPGTLASAMRFSTSESAVGGGSGSTGGPGGVWTDVAGDAVSPAGCAGFGPLSALHAPSPSAAAIAAALRITAPVRRCADCLADSRHQRHERLLGHLPA